MTGAALGEGLGVNEAPALALDHLVIAAATLAEGVAWCRETLGIVPDGGGAHPLMGTHNRIFGIGGADHPRAYAEVIAIDPTAAAPGRPRWFGLDEPALQGALRDDGPRLIHWVARCDNIASAAAAQRGLGCEPGAVIAAERGTANGVLRWRITVPADGRPACGGAAPTLIEWGGAVHPSASLAANGVALRELTLGRPLTMGVASADSFAAWAGAAVRVDAGQDAALRAVLDTPRGSVVLESRSTLF